ncbi:ribonuclease HI [Gracilibacillus halotolerans]|uniref:Ribonuclease HI n=1 Tax=Gracilibacillus halotolerans TaxID=74386 RepID=A0A841RLK2_9BACI|nr:ribonuclease HI family protein [Gracilibacillus halotolerans]MBB6511608.1 ribonuclease HI [Gracilibacillus halotolerans]
MIELYTDGACQGNPGPSGIGLYIKINNERIRLSEYIGHCTNHEAEFIAILKGLEYCQQYYPNEIISLRSDSKTAVEAIERKFSKNENFQPYITRINELAETFPYFFIKWIPEKLNKSADQLAKKAIHNPL